MPNIAFLETTVPVIPSMHASPIADTSTDSSSPSSGGYASDRSSSGPTPPPALKLKPTLSINVAPPPLPTKRTSPLEVVHRSTWSFKRSHPKNPDAFRFVVPGDLGVPGKKEGKLGKAWRKAVERFRGSSGEESGSTSGSSPGDASSEASSSPDRRVDTIQERARAVGVPELAPILPEISLSQAVLPEFPSPLAPSPEIEEASQPPSAGAESGNMSEPRYSTDNPEAKNTADGQDDSIEGAARIVFRALRYKQFRQAINVRTSARVNAHEQRLAKRQDAAVTIQRAYKSYSLRAAVDNRIEIRRLPRKVVAATTIQRFYRRCLTRSSFKYSPGVGMMQKMDPLVVKAWSGRMLRSELAWRGAQRRRQREEAARRVWGAWQGAKERDRARIEGQATLTALKREREERIREAESQRIIEEERRMEELRIKIEATRIEEQRRDDEPKLLPQVSTLGPLPSLPPAIRPRTPSNPATPASARGRHSRRTSTSSAVTRSRDSSCSRMSMISTTSSEFKVTRKVDHNDFPRMDWEDREDAKNLQGDKMPGIKVPRLVEHTEFPRMTWEEREEAKEMQEKLPKFKTTRGGGTFGEFVPLSVTEREVDPEKASRMRKVSGQSGFSSGRSTPLTSRRSSGVWGR